MFVTIQLVIFTEFVNIVRFSYSTFPPSNYQSLAINFE